MIYEAAPRQQGPCQCRRTRRNPWASHTTHNWLRHDIIRRASVGGRQLRARLFSIEQVYKAAFVHELVGLGIPPSAGSDAVNELWVELNRKEIVDGPNVYAIIVPKGAKWKVTLCWQKRSGGPLYRSSASKPSEAELPHEAFAVVPISDVFGRVRTKLSETLNVTKKRLAKGSTS